MSRVALDLRSGPSANVVLVGGERPVLVDAGSGTVASDARTLAFLAEHGVVPAQLSWLALTHFHADHAGGAAALQRDHGVPVAAHAREAVLVNARDPEACDGAFLAFGIGPYTVQRALADGDAVEDLEVVHTPGQTPGHVAYWLASERVAITGDLLQADDVAWIRFGGPWSEGALERTVASVERIAALEPLVAISGHGPPVTDVPAAVERTLERYARFAQDPERAVWHAVRRAVVSHLMTEPSSATRLAAMPWARAAAARLGTDAEALLGAALGGLTERGVVVARNGAHATTLPHEPPGPLSVGPGDPAGWPRAGRSS